MAARKKSKRSKKGGGQAPSKRGRKVPPEEIELRINVFQAQEEEGFTNAEAADRAGMGLPAWNQWKQKYRKQSGAGPVRRGRKPKQAAASSAPAASPAAASSAGGPGRRVSPEEQQQRIEVYEAQLAEGFTNADAAARAGIGLPAWNQWKQKYRKTGGRASRRGRPAAARTAAPAAAARPAAAAPAARPAAAPAPTPMQVEEFLENARLRGRIAELEAMLEALSHIFQQFRSR